MATRIIMAAGACLATMVGLSVNSAQAQVIYFGGEAGWSVLQDQTTRSAGFANGKSKFDDGFAVGARIGYEMGPWRFEEEYTYRRNTLSSLNVAGVGVPGASGSRQAHTFMTNVLYDFDLGWPVTPHIGAGIGAVNVIDQASAPDVGRIFDDSDWRLGYQAIGGIRYNVTPNVALDVDYRYLATTEATFRVPTTGTKYKSGYESHNLMASLVYRFGPPPPPVAAPPAPPAPAPVQRRVFLVFFDWDKATITGEGMSIIQQAAAAYRSGAPVQIQVTGYADRSGSPGYNQRLSERRANAVANALAQQGVPRNDMMVSGRGENDNRVPTADGVREPQNRRVEIVFP